MKKYLFIILAAILGSLSSCYQYDHYDRFGSSIPDLKTLPATLDEKKFLIELHGDYEGRFDWHPDRNLLGYQIGRTRDFSGETIYISEVGETIFITSEGLQCSLNMYQLSGDYYYRVFAVCGNDTIYAPNAEAFEVDNQALLIQDPEAVSSTSFRVSCLYNYRGAVSFLVSTDKDFKEYTKYDSNMNSYGDSYTYYAIIDGLSKGTTYYVKAVVDVLLGSLETDAVSFSTEDNGIKAVTIYGNGIDGQPVKDDLLLVFKDGRTGEWSKPYTAVYDEAKKNYDILDFDFTVDPNTGYVVYAVTSPASAPTRWDSSGYVVFDYNSKGYADGIPISWGITEVDGYNPYLKLEMRPWTAQVKVEYPASWGAIYINEGLIIIDKRGDYLPGGIYYVDSRESVWGVSENKAVPYGDPVLSDDGSTYSFIFNIFPTHLTPDNCSMHLYLDNGERTLPCPDLNIQMGGSYVISFSDIGLEIPEVTVKTWEETNGGNITITPKF